LVGTAATRSNTYSMAVGLRNNLSPLQRILAQIPEINYSSPSKL